MPFKTKEELERYIQELKNKPVTAQVLVCGGLGCLAKGAEAVYKRFQELIEKNQLSATVEKTTDDHQPSLKETGCMGLCEAGPLVRIEPKGILYLRVKPEDVDRIVEETLINNRVVDDLVYQEETNQEIRKWPLMKDVPFYRKQKKIVLRNCGSIDPEELDDYLFHDGYLALQKSLRL